MVSAERDFAVSIRGLSKAYRRGSTVTPVLEQIDLDIPRGACSFLVGPSGSGKTTLLSIIGCLLSPDQGEVSVLGNRLEALNERRRAQLRLSQIGFVFQRFNLIRGLTAVDNVAVPRQLAGESQRSARRRAEELLIQVGLGDFRTSDPRRMSSGQCQRVALARALAADPELILADEPTASLDAANGEQVLSLLRDLTAVSGKTAIVVTHDPRIFRFADQMFRLDSGRLVESSVSPSPAPASGGMG